MDSLKFWYGARMDSVYDTSEAWKHQRSKTAKLAEEVAASLDQFAGVIEASLVAAT